MTRSHVSTGSAGTFGKMRDAPCICTLPASIAIASCRGSERPRLKLATTQLRMRTASAPTSWGAVIWLLPRPLPKPLSDAARDLGKGRGKSQITAPHEVGALAVRIRNCVVASFRRGRSEPRQLAIAIEAGRVQMHGASRIFPNVPADPVDTWERVIRENPRKRTTTLDAGYAETLLEKCSTAAGNPRGSEIFRREEKAEERAEERRSPPK